MKTIIRWILVFFGILSPALWGVESPVSLQAVRTAKAPVLDGLLDEAVWKAAAPFAGFKQVFPTPGGWPEFHRRPNFS